MATDYGVRMPALTRGPLPPSVYWRRRLILMTVALVVLWGALHLLGGGGSTPKATPAADLTGAIASTSPAASAGGSTTPSTGSSADPSAPAMSVTPTPTPTPSPTVRPTPTGACPPSDIGVTPSAPNASAGSKVAIVLTLRTFETPACTWHVSHKTMQVKVASTGGGEVWSTVECPSAVPTSDVVVYRDSPTPVTVTWSARRSDATCSAHTAWSKPGSYSVTGVALGGVPDQATFTLAAPVATPPPAKPSNTPSSTPTSTPDGKPSGAPSASGSAAPTGSATPTGQHKKKHQIVD